jgi:putative MATE family efflux protein
MLKGKFRRFQDAGKSAITEGPIWKALVAIALPIVLANILHSAYNFTDAFWVGRLGGEAVAAVSVGFPVVFFVMTLGAGFAIAGSTMVAQYLGSGYSKKVNAVAAQTIMMALVSAVTLTIAGWISAPFILRVFEVEHEIFFDALTYMRFSMLGLTAIFAFSMFQSLMRGIGEVMMPLGIVLATVLLNFVLDPLLIFGWGPVPPLGVAGAAFATLSTQTLAAMTGIWIFMSGYFGIHIRLKDLRPDRELILSILKLGYPASIEQAVRALGMNVMVFLVAGFGTSVVAAYGVGSNVLRFVFVPAMGLSFAASALVGQNIGARNVERAHKIAYLSALIAFVVLSAVGVFAFFFAEEIMRFFVPGDAQVIELGAVFIRIMGPSFGFMGAQQTLAGAFRGAGDTHFAMATAIILQWVVQFPLALILSKHTPLGIIGIWWAFPMSFALTALLSVWWFVRGSWMTKRLSVEKQFEEEVSEEIISEEGLR